MRYGVLLLLLLALNCTAATTVVIGAEDDWYPYTGNVKGEASGISVDLVREAFATKGVQVDFKVMPYARCLELTRRGELLACFNTSRSVAVESEFLWPDEPMLRAVIAIYAKAGSAEHSLGVKQLEGKRVAVTRAYEYGSEFDANGRILREVADRDITGFRMLQAGRVDYAVAFEKVASHLLRKYFDAGDNAFKIVGKVTQAEVYLAFSKTYAQSEHFLGLFNQGFASIRKNGKTREIEQRWK